MGEEIDVVVVGAGQAGLSVSHELTQAGIGHVVLERDRMAASWRGRWDSFCLVTPNDSILLPGGAYDGDDPHGFLPRDGVVAHLERYAAGFGAPVRPGARVRSLRPGDGGTLTLGTDDGAIMARAVVVATGAYPRAHRPDWVSSVPDWLPVLDAADYRNPGALPPGGVVVVGSGQTGCQLAEELHLAGRHVVLACGRAPWAPRRIDGRDIVDWLRESSFFDQSVADLPTQAERLVANVQNSGARGGHDLNYRTLAALGVELAGHVLGAEGDTAYFAGDLAGSVEFGDNRWAMLRGRIRAVREARGLPVPEMPDPAPFGVVGGDHLDLHGFGSVILAAGYRPAYRGWVQAADAFDELGFPLHRNGASSVVPGLYFVGVHFLRTRGSSLLLGVGDDARLVAEQIIAAQSRGRGSHRVITA